MRVKDFEKNINGDIYWSIPSSKYQLLMNWLTTEYRWVDVWADYFSKKQCDIRCQTATGDDCECTCDSEYHGIAHTHKDKWKQIKDRPTLVKYEPRRTLTRYTATGGSVEKEQLFSENLPKDY